MNKATLFGSGLLVMALVVGCGGGSPEDNTMKEMISLNDQLVVVFEKVSDGPSWKEAIKKMNEFKDKAKPIMEKVTAWPKEKQDEMKKKYDSQIKAGEEKLKTALGNAAKKAGPDALKDLLGGF